MNIEEMMKNVADIRNDNKVGSDEVLDELINNFYSCYRVNKYGKDAKGLEDYEASSDMLVELYDKIFTHISGK